jgi:hypothetical protein
MDNKTQKILFIAIAITMIAAAFYGGMVYENTQPSDIVIVGVNASGDMVQSDILPLAEDTRIVFPSSETVTEYHLTYGH